MPPFPNVKKIPSEMYYANKLAAILSVVDRALYEKFKNDAPSAPSSSGEEPESAITPNSTYTHARDVLKGALKKSNVGAADATEKGGKCEFPLYPFVFLLYQKVFMPQEYVIRIRVSGGSYRTFCELCPGRTEFHEWHSKGTLKISLCQSQRRKLHFKDRLATAMDDSSEEETDEKRLINIYTTTPQSSKTATVYNHPQLQQKEQIQNAHYRSYEKHTINKLQEPPIDEFDFNIRIREAEEEAAQERIECTRITRILRFLKKCLFYAFVFVFEVIYRTCQFVFMVLTSKNVWNVLTVAFFALLEAFIHFVMAIVTIFVEIIVLIEESRKPTHQEAVHFEDNTRPGKEILPIEQTVFPPADDIPVHTLRAQGPIIGDF